MGRGRNRGSRSGRKRFNPTESGGGWRAGRYRLLALPRIDPDGAIFPREKWGTTAFTLEGAERAPVDVHVIRDPEGLAVCGICHFCGGRYEALIDAHDFSTHYDSGLEDEAREALEHNTAVTLNPIMAEWAPRHAHCASEPLQFQTPGLVQDFVDSVLDAARTDIARGVPYLGHTILLDTDGRAVSYPIHDIPPSKPGGTSRVSALAERKAAARNFVLARDLDILAAVTVAEVWVTGTPAGDGMPETGHPWISAERKEALSALITTTEFGRSGTAFIERAGGVADEGPGRVGDFDWSLTPGRSPLMDGLLATTMLRTMGEEERKRKGGVFVGGGGDG